MKRVTIVLCLLALSGCSLSSLTGTSNKMTAGEANSFAQQIAQALSYGVSGTSPAPAQAPLTAQGGALATAVNVQVDHTTSCTSGGDIHVLGNMTGNIDNSGSGVLLLQVDETITDWKCIANFVINGDPYLSVAGNIDFLSGVQSSPATFSFGGGFKWGSSASESCQINLTVLINPDGSGTVSGTVCNDQVNMSV